MENPPAVEAGTYKAQLREQYLSYARRIMRQPQLDYKSLYQQFGNNEWAAKRLDQAVAMTALRDRKSPSEAAYLLAQGPHVQKQTGERGMKPADLIDYAKLTVTQGMQSLQRSQRNQVAQQRSQTPRL